MHFVAVCNSDAPAPGRGSANNVNDIAQNAKRSKGERSGAPRPSSVLTGFSSDEDTTEDGKDVASASAPHLPIVLAPAAPPVRLLRHLCCSAHFSSFSCAPTFDAESPAVVAHGKEKPTLPSNGVPSKDTLQVWLLIDGVV